MRQALRRYDYTVRTAIVRVVPIPLARCTYRIHTQLMNKTVGEFDLAAGHRAVVTENSVGQWGLTVWAADRCVGHDYGNLPVPSPAVLEACAARVVETARRWDRIGV